MGYGRGGVPHHRRRGGAQRPRHPEGRQGRACASSAASEVCYVAQSAAAAFNPAHRLMDQVVEAALRHGIAQRAPKRKSAPCAVPEARPARSGKHRRALPAPGVGRPAAARDDGDGALPRARPDRLRRADDRARRDHADRRARGDQARHRRDRRRRALHHPRPRRRRAGGRRHHGAAPRQDGRMGRHAPDHQGAARGIHQRLVSVRKTARGADARTSRRRCRSRTSTPPMAAARSRC